MQRCGRTNTVPGMGGQTGLVLSRRNQTIHRTAPFTQPREGCQRKEGREGREGLALPIGRCTWHPISNTKHQLQANCVHCWLMLTETRHSNQVTPYSPLCLHTRAPHSSQSYTTFYSLADSGLRAFGLVVKRGTNGVLLLSIRSLNSDCGLGMFITSRRRLDDA